MNQKSLKILIAGTAFLTLVVLAGLFFLYPKGDTPEAELPVSDWSVPGENLGDVGPQTPLLPETTDPSLDSPFQVTLEDDQPAPAEETIQPAVEQPRTPPVQEVKPAPARPAPRPVTPAPSVPKVKVTEFWIQVAAYADRYSAERSGRVLSDRSLNPVLFTAKTANGTTVYRVRVGPYQNRQEAEKYLTWIKEIPDFKGSFVTQATALREVR